jgi:hypothetical protein
VSKSFTFSTNNIQYLQNIYKKYLLAFDKDINRIYDNKRLLNFNKTLNLIHEHNMINPYFTLSLNSFADNHDYETASMFTIISTPPNNGSTDSKRTLHNKLPDSFDWSNENNPMFGSVVSPVRDQGPCGACWAFVAVSATESSVRIRNNFLAGSPKDVVLSVQELIDCDIIKNRGCSGGNPIFAYDYIVEKGLTSNENYPYDAMVIYTR